VVNRTEHARSAKALVVYYSLTGNTARVARDIAKRTRADLESIRDRDHGAGFFGLVQNAIDALRNATTRIASLAHDPAEYGLIVIGTPVWAGRMTPAIRAYLERTRGRFGRVAFFTTSGNTSVERLLPALEAAAQVHAVGASGFNARELKDPKAYEDKLATFLAVLQGKYVAAEPLPTPERARAI
jgi:flavodoxin